MKRKLMTLVIAGSMIASLAACGSSSSSATSDTTAESTVTEETATEETDSATEETGEAEASTEGSTQETSTSSGTYVEPTTEATSDETKASIEAALDLSQNSDQEWTYDSSNDAWVLSIVCAVTNPEIEDEQGVSVGVPGAYVTGIDTDGDGAADVTSADASSSVNGSLVIDYEASVTSENGQVYTAATAPVVITTGAAGYSEQSNQTASTSYCTNGYVTVACGNRGKQSSVSDADGNTVYTGDAPDCLVDQKNAVRYVKYNQLLGNIPGSVDYWVSTGGSGGGAHATMLAATSNNSDFYDYEIEAGAVGVYRNEDGSYSTTVTVDGTDYELSDGLWGCVAYSAITSLAEGDMTLAFEYNLDTDYSFNTSFQAQLAEYLSEEYMTYINDQGLTISEAAVGFDLNDDGDTDDTVDLTIEYDEEAYADTNGYGGTYLDLYLAEFTSNLQWYVDNLSYGEGWTWFDADGNALSDEDVAAMTSEDKAQAFIEGRYAAGSSGSGGMEGGPSGGAPSGGAPSGDFSMGEMPDGGSMGEMPDGGSMGEMPDDTQAEASSSDTESTEEVGTPDQGTTQASGSSTDSANYSTFDEMVAAYESDIAEIEAGDAYGKNIVQLYNPLNYIGADSTADPTWTTIVMGASEGDMSMFASLNLEIAMLNAGTDAEIEWQWDGGHVPSEILGNSLSLRIDEMYGKYVDGAVEVTKAEASAQTENGDAEEATGTDLSSWVSYADGAVSFSLADIASYRTSGAAKAIPGFDVMDYGQETYEFGSTTQDARHFSTYVLKAFQEHADTLSELFNAG